MHHLQMLHLKKFCQKNGLDYQLIDESITYSENMNYLKSLVSRDVEDLLWEGESQDEWFMKSHFLSYYVGCILDGKTMSKDVGKPRIGFSLRAYIEANRFFGVNYGKTYQSQNKAYWFS